MAMRTVCADAFSASLAEIPEGRSGSTSIRNQRRRTMSESSVVASAPCCVRLAARAKSAGLTGFRV